MKNKIITVLVVLAVIALGVWLFWPSSKSDSGNSNAQVSNHTQGEGKKGVVLVQYGDFQCPGCGAFYPILKEVNAKYKSDITFRFVNFPLDSIHQNARAAHRAAEAASNQNKFWEMHDVLYETQTSWTNSSDVRTVFEGFAEKLGLDMTRYKSDYASSATNDTINADISSGQDLKVTGTPTFFLDGVELVNTDVSTVEKFSATIDAAILKKNPGTTPAPSTETPSQ